MSPRPTKIVTVWCAANSKSGLVLFLYFTVAQVCPSLVLAEESYYKSVLIHGRVHGFAASFLIEEQWKYNVVEDLFQAMFMISPIRPGINLPYGKRVGLLSQGRSPTCSCSGSAIRFSMYPQAHHEPAEYTRQRSA